MVKRRFAKRGGKRRGGYRRGRRGGKTTLNSLLRSSVRPDRLLVKLPYNQIFQLQTPSGGGVSKIMNINSIYDPDRSGIGHQPLGYDQWAKFYNKYRVFKVAYNITFSNVNVTTDAVDGGALVGLLFANGPGVTTVTDAAFEQPHLRKGFIGAAAGVGIKTFKGTVSLPHITGRPLVSYKSDNIYSATFGNNPTEFMTMSMLVQSALATSDPAVTVSVRLVYFVELYDALVLELSNTEPENRGPDPNVGQDKAEEGYKPTV